MNTNTVVAHQYRGADLEGENIKHSLGIDSLAQLMRILGGVMLFVSAAAYLFQGWTGFSGIEKSHNFLAFSVILSSVGFFLGLKVKEDKGARTLLGTSASFLPIHFAQLGAIIYATKMGKSGEFPNHYNLLEFAPAASAFQLLLTSTLVVGGMFGVVYLGMSVMARSHAWKLTILSFLSSALLLVPVRDATTVAIACLVALAALVFLDNKYFSEDSSLRTFEGRIARLLPLISIAVLAGRNILLYPTTDLFVAIFCLAWVMAFTWIPRQHLKNFKTLGILIQSLALPPLLIYSVLVADSVDHLVPFSSQVTSILFTVGCLILSKTSLSTGRNYRRLGVSSLVFILTTASIGVSINLISLAFALAAGVFAVAYGYHKNCILSFLAGCLGLGFTFLYRVNILAIFQELNSWMVFGGFGLLVVIFSSLLERKDNALFRGVKKIKSRFLASKPISGLVHETLVSE